MCNSIWNVFSIISIGPISTGKLFELWKSVIISYPFTLLLNQPIRDTTQSQDENKDVHFYCGGEKW